MRRTHHSISSIIFYHPTQKLYEMSECFVERPFVRPSLLNWVTLSANAIHRCSSTERTYTHNKIKTFSLTFDPIWLYNKFEFYFSCLEPFWNACWNGVGYFEIHIHAIPFNRNFIVKLQIISNPVSHRLANQRHPGKRNKW